MNKKKYLLLVKWVCWCFVLFFSMGLIARVLGGLVCFYKVGFFCFGVDGFNKSLLAGVIGGGFVGLGSWLMTIFDLKK